MALQKNTEYDAIVVGSGPNGLSAAIVLQQAGLSVLVVEARDTAGGGLRTAELTLPGFKHDVCSAIHPLALASPFLSKLPLAEYGLEFINPPVAVAHPFDDGKAAVILHSLEDTAKQLGIDADTYHRVIGSVVRDWSLIKDTVLSPLRFPSNPIAMARFGLKALPSAMRISRQFKTREAKGLWAGLAAHSILPLTHTATSAIGLVLAATAHLVNWPLAKGGSQSIADALTRYFKSLGGKLQTGIYVKSLDQLPSSKALLFDTNPRQLLEIAGHRFSKTYQWQLKRFRFGMGIFKIDWALDGPIPFTAEKCRQAGTVHLGNTIEEISASEQQAWTGKHPEKPFVLLTQPSIFDPERAPHGRHTAWAYCHVPNGSEKDMTAAIENQVERFAPGFKQRILARHTMNTRQLEEYNPNYQGGDIIGGATDITQLFTRPALRRSPYRTSARGIYICSSSTPPGGGVHGMCGYHAAQRVLRDIFKRA